MGLVGILFGITVENDERNGTFGDILQNKMINTSCTISIYIFYLENNK